MKSWWIRTKTLLYDISLLLYLWFKSSIFSFLPPPYHHHHNPQRIHCCVARTRVFICQERINIPRKFISLNRQWAGVNFFFSMLLSDYMQIMNVLAPSFLASTNVLFPFHESYSQCLRFFSKERKTTTMMRSERTN